MCPVCSDFILLDVVEWPLEPYRLRGVLVIPEEELEGADGDPDFRMFHREDGFWTSPEALWEDLREEPEKLHR